MMLCCWQKGFNTILFIFSPMQDAVMDVVPATPIAEPDNFVESGNAKADAPPNLQQKRARQPHVGLPVHLEKEAAVDDKHADDANVSEENAHSLAFIGSLFAFLQ